MKPLSAEMRAELTEQEHADRSRRCWCASSRKKPSSKSGSRTRRAAYALLKTYPICRWSGELGPKIKEGDRQAPEGFYTITPAQMNPNSQLLSRVQHRLSRTPSTSAWGRTGAHLMVHGDCSSRGCYAMTDEQIGEIYALAREIVLRRPALVPGAGLSVPHDAGEHRASIATTRTSPFWRMLKEGYDHFEVTRQEPRRRGLREALRVQSAGAAEFHAGEQRHQDRHAVGRLPRSADAAGLAEVQSDRQVSGLRGAGRRGHGAEGKAAAGQRADRVAVAA